MKSLEELRRYLIAFAEARDWDKFHNPKNLCMALSVEVAELSEHFQWLSADESAHLNDERREQVAAELADVQMYLILLANKLNINLLEAASHKARVNEERYPAELVRGKADKYTAYQSHPAPSSTPSPNSD